MLGVNTFVLYLSLWDGLIFYLIIVWMWIMTDISFNICLADLFSAGLCWHSFAYGIWATSICPFAYLNFPPLSLPPPRWCYQLSFELQNTSRLKGVLISMVQVKDWNCKIQECTKGILALSISVETCPTSSVSCNGSRKFAVLAFCDGLKEDGTIGQIWPRRLWG